MVIRVFLWNRQQAKWPTQDKPLACVHTPRAHSREARALVAITSRSWPRRR